MPDSFPARQGNGIFPANEGNKGHAMKRLLRWWWVAVVGVVVAAPAALVFRTQHRGLEWVSKFRWLTPREFSFAQSDSTLILTADILQPDGHRRRTKEYEGSYRCFGIFSVESCEVGRDVLNQGQFVLE